MAAAKEEMKKKAVVFVAAFFVLFVLYTYGARVVRLVAPCPSRSELEFQLHDFMKYRAAQSRGDKTKEEAMKNLTGPHVLWNDPKLVGVVRDYFVDPPRPYVTKFSLPLTQTPQAKVVDEVLKGKVSADAVSGHFVYTWNGENALAPRRIDEEEGHALWSSCQNIHMKYRSRTACSHSIHVLVLLSLSTFQAF